MPRTSGTPSGEVVMAGRADIRQAFGDLFAAHPRVHVDITNRMVLGRLVVDAERITGRADIGEI
ncbi:MAG: hypothetical protein HYR71_07375, partial [Chloroflexi bacterium]|nr:hypothetical protein [Chloroflexota bacterium]